MKLTPNQRVVLAVLSGADGGLIAAEVAARSGRRYIPGVIRVLESLRGDGLVSPLDGQVARRWRITEAGQSALTRHFWVRNSTENGIHAPRPTCERLLANPPAATAAKPAGPAVHAVHVDQ